MEDSTPSLLRFELADRRFALLVAAVREVTRAVAWAALPNAPPIVEGAIDYRGTVVPLLDIRQRFAVPPREVSAEQHFIVADAGNRLVALRVDRALDIVHVASEAISPSLQGIASVAGVRGLAQLPDGVVAIHDLDAFLSLDESRQLDAALRPGAP